MRVHHALIAIAIAGCTPSVRLGTDDPRTYPDGATIIHCGPVDCRPGQVCCSATCGICASPLGCTSSGRDCPDASTLCGADRVTLTSAGCARWVWDGVDCVVRNGCDCTGEGCANTRASYVDCMDAHTNCWSHVCDHARNCPSGYFCGRARCDSPTGVCTQSPIDDCVSAPRLAICGCDGYAYPSRCEAQRASQTVATSATCGICNAPDVTITPGCATDLGWAWDGARCVQQTGCGCTGACDRLEATQSECMNRYAGACGPLFPCDATSCERGREMCVLASTGGMCRPMPTTCAVLDCACVSTLGIAMTGCSDDGAGGVTVR